MLAELANNGTQTNGNQTEPEIQWATNNNDDKRRHGGEGETSKRTGKPLVRSSVGNSNVNDEHTSSTIELALDVVTKVRSDQ